MVTFDPIGRITTEEGFRLELEKPYGEGLIALEGFSHVEVLWHAHLCGNAGDSALVLSKPYVSGPDAIGVFATRSPYRPNAICTSVASVLQVDREHNIVHLAWIDAQEGSPILDIKPYHGSECRARDLEVPSWCAHWPQWIEDSELFAWEGEFTF